MAHYDDVDGDVDGYDDVDYDVEDEGDAYHWNNIDEEVDCVAHDR